MVASQYLVTQNTISVLCGNTTYCVKLSGEDLSRFSNKSKSVGLRKCPYYHYLTKKVMSQYQTLLRACPHHGGNIAGRKKLSHCHPIVSTF